MNAVPPDPAWLTRADDAGELRELLASHRLVPHFQPIVQLSDGAVLASEALIRTPADCRWRAPDELFGAARACGMQIELELECLRLALDTWTRLQPAGQAFVNLSAQALVAALAQRDLQSLLTAWGRSGVTPRGLVIELTEHEHVQDVELMMAGAVITVLPVIVVFLLLQRSYVQGVMQGSVKG